MTIKIQTNDEHYQIKKIQLMITQWHVLNNRNKHQNRIIGGSPMRTIDLEENDHCGSLPWDPLLWIQEVAMVAMVVAV